jgi:hypothetical protein
MQPLVGMVKGWQLSCYYENSIECVVTLLLKQCKLLIIIYFQGYGIFYIHKRFLNLLINQSGVAYQVRTVYWVLDLTLF